jgi:hypothetical protein
VFKCSRWPIVAAVKKIDIVLSHSPFTSRGYEMVCRLGKGSYGAGDSCWKRDVGFRAVKQ